MPEQTYTLTVTLTDLRVLSAGLHELPYKLVADLLTRLQREVDAQDKAREAKSKPVKEEVSQ